MGRLDLAVVDSVGFLDVLVLVRHLLLAVDCFLQEVDAVLHKSRCSPSLGVVVHGRRHNHSLAANHVLQVSAVVLHVHHAEALPDSMFYYWSVPLHVLYGFGDIPDSGTVDLAVLGQVLFLDSRVPLAYSASGHESRADSLPAQ